MEEEKHECMIYLAEYDYDGYDPVYIEEGRIPSWHLGDSQFYFDFCPLCGKKIDRPE